MGSSCAKCRTAVVDAIPDKEVMLKIVDTIAVLEDKLKRGRNAQNNNKVELPSDD